MLATSLLKVRKLNNLVRVIMIFAPLCMQTETVTRHGENLIMNQVRLLHKIVSDIISVISPPPPGHTSYPKRKLETLFSPQLGDEEWLGSGNTSYPGLPRSAAGLMSDVTLQRISFVCRGLIMREMSGPTMRAQ